MSQLVTNSSRKHPLRRKCKLPSATLAAVLSLSVNYHFKSGKAHGDKSLTETSTEAEMQAAVSHFKSGNAQGPDHIAPEFISNCGTLMLNWLRESFSQCMCGLILPKVWKRADSIAVLKPNKSADDANNYRAISLLCVSLKLRERILLSRLDPVIDPQLTPEQAGFRHGRSTTDRVTLLTDDIEAGFEHNITVGVALIDLTAAYDTVWLRGLHLKLLRMLPDRHMVSFVTELSHQPKLHVKNQ